MSKQRLIDLPSRRGWPVKVDGDTLDALKRLQAAQLAPPSYTGLIRRAVLDMEAVTAQAKPKRSQP